ncbi:YD repeat-containing protein, partial [Pseudidiomarina donghaiensis]
MVQKNTVVNGTIYSSRTVFDGNYGRVKAIEHASGIKVAYDYDRYGYVLRVKNASSGFVYHENLQADAQHNITQAEKNNGTLYENRNYDAISGQLTQVNAASAMGNELHYIEYTYGRFGNLASQSVHSNNGATSTSEWYSYDDLHRLTSSSLSSG